MSASEIHEADPLGMLPASELAEAISGTLATVQGVADRVFGGMTRMQAAGAAVSAVPVASGNSPSVETTQAPPPPPSPLAQGQAEGAPSFAPESVVPAAAEMPAVAPAAVAGAGRGEGIAAPGAPAASPTLYASFAPQVAAAANGSVAGGVAGDANALSWPEASPASVPPVWGDASAPASATFEDYSPVAAAPSAIFSPRAASTPASPRHAAPEARRDGGDRGGSGPTGGDVFLDGARVGTWLADHLAREAGRPQSGGTGFDPRLTAPWPGTLQGG